IGRVGLILVNGLGVFWPADLEKITLREGGVVLGQIKERELDPQKADEKLHRIKVKRANRDIDTADFVWLDDSDIADRAKPIDDLIIERRERGAFKGKTRAVKEGNKILAGGPVAGLAAVNERLPKLHRLQDRITKIKKNETADISSSQEKLRLKFARLERQGITAGP